MEVGRGGGEEKVLCVCVCVCVCVRGVMSGESECVGRGGKCIYNALFTM